MSIASKYDYASACPLLCKLFPLKEELTEIASFLQEIEVKSGETIVNEDDFVDSFYLVIRGKARVVSAESLHKKSSEIAILSCGETIGLSESGFFSLTGRRTAKVIAISDMLLLRCDIKDFKAFVEKYNVSDKALRETANLLLKLNFIKQVSPLKHLAADRIYTIAKKIIEIKLPPDTFIFHQGDTADCCYLLQSGRVEVLSDTSGGSLQKISELEPSTVFGEAALLTTDVRNASVRTTEETNLLKLEKNLLLDLMKSDNTFSQSMVGLMASRFRPQKGKDIDVFYSESPDKQKIINLEQTKLGYFYHLTPESLFVWEQLDGVNTIQDITMKLHAKYNVFSPESICNLLYDMSSMGFVIIPTINVESESSDKVSLWKRFIYVLNQFQTEYTIKNIDPILGKVYNAGVKWLFARLFQILFFCMVVVGLISLISSYKVIFNDIATFNYPFWYFILLIIPINAVTVILHELAHAFTTKYFGHKVQRIGIGWAFLGPFMYADTSQMWLEKNIPRFLVDIAGVYMDCFIAGILSFLAIFLFNGHYGLSVLFWLASFFTYFHAFKNLSPLKEFDGYFICIDLLDKRGLKMESLKWAKQVGFKALLKSKTYIDSKPEAVYWLICFAYIISSSIFTYTLLQLFFEAFSSGVIFGIKTNHISLVISLFYLIMPFISIYSKVKHTE